ncbi:uncharacterized protein MYCFIDRAFT_75252 [Pseudocercospora fijiensis CIRAD86]|uniref:NAD(P)-binding domain-containing protein n=1 Tax=Pseudocercospora fijiensis (strain CIRAD86) TaxID=383855 RepID=N1Q906_PSEFD|nr:uncharacterized protein MYCFIDRAFT_75252 [Pseudocercospora fijiensis CIRAD86]EME87392.1 hypothetical protein MYCFIDRAFT_75252 [Pseudocercospora fijiensis CIRAD86]
MSSKPTILITAAGGHIGSELIPLLLNEHVNLVLPTSNASRLQTKYFPSSNTTPSNVSIEEGPITDPHWVESILKTHKVTSVFLNLIGTDELLTTLNFFDSMQRAGTVKNLVYVSACGDFADTFEGFKKTLTSNSAAHVLVKPLIEYKLLLSEYSWTTTRLGPTMFFDNDIRRKERIREGFFDEPISDFLGKGQSKVSCEDIAIIARNSLLDPKRWAGKKIMIGSLKRYSGAEVAGLWSEAVLNGKEMKRILGGNARLENYEAKAEFPLHGSWAWPRDLRLMYETWAEDGFGMTEEEYAVQVEALGREPRRYEDWVRGKGRELVLEK